MRFLLILALVLVSCGKHGLQRTRNPTKVAWDKGRFYTEKITDPYELVDRCDALTFVGLFDAYGRRIDIYRHNYTILSTGNLKYDTGQWNRDVRPCYPNDSRSAISTEGMLGAIHAMLARADHDRLHQTVEFLEGNQWIGGEGPLEYTHFGHLAGLLHKIQRRFTLSSSSSDIRNKLKGYKGNVIADYIDLYGRVNGFIKRWMLDFMAELVRISPENPIYQAIYHKYLDGNQTETLKILLNEELFPSDTLPEKHLDAFDWSGAPSAILYIYAVSILNDT